MNDLLCSLYLELGLELRAVWLQEHRLPSKAHSSSLPCAQHPPPSGPQEPKTGKCHKEGCWATAVGGTNPTLERWHPHQKGKLG